MAAASAKNAGAGVTLADDVLKMFGPLQAARKPWETEWQECADLALPSASRGARIGATGTRSDPTQDEPSSRVGARRRMETTPVRLVNMLGSIMESLATPEQEKWHGYQVDNIFGGAADAAELQWCDRLRDYTFGARYDARSGFALANKKSIKSAVALGTGIFMVEDFIAGGAALPWRYRYCPLSNSYLAVDAHGFHDTNFILTEMTAQQIATHPVWGAKASSAVKDAANSPDRSQTTFQVLQAVFPRRETGSKSNPRRNAGFTCVAMEYASKTILEESGYDDFPFNIDVWEPSESAAYGEGAVAYAIDEIRGLMHARRLAGVGLGMAVRPPTATSHDGVMFKPNMNPGRNNPGGIDGNGNKRIQTLMDPPRLDHIQAVLDAERGQVKSALYGDLMQVLATRPDMTAAEVWMRAGEKGDIFGPIGKNFQAARARLNEREIAIIEKRGAFAQGSFLAPPPSLAGRRLRVKSSSPLDRLRRSSEAQGTERLLGIAAQIEPARPVLSRKFDVDFAYEVFREAFGAPAGVMLSKEQAAANDQAQQAQMQQQQMLAAAGPTARAAKDVAGAMKTGAETPGLAEQIQTLLASQSGG